LFRIFLRGDFTELLGRRERNYGIDGREGRKVLESARLE
jgi:hypothetical protein